MRKKRQIYRSSHRQRIVNKDRAEHEQFDLQKNKITFSQSEDH